MKTKKQKRWLACLMAVAMLLAMLPMTVLAVDTHKVAINNFQYGMGIAGISGVVSNTYYLVDTDGTLKTDGVDENNYNIYYDESAARLTINNLQLQAENKWLLVPGGTTVNVLGTNRIEPSEGGTYGGGIAAVSDGDITITGTGSLYIKSSSYAGLCRGLLNNLSYPSTTGGFTINGSVDLTIDHNGAANCISANQGDIVIGGSAKVTLDPRAGSDKDNSAITRFDGGNIIIQDSAEVTSTGGFDTTGTNSKGEYGKIIISGGTVTINNDASSGVSLRGYGGVEIGEGADVTVTSYTKSGQAIASSYSPLKVDGTLKVTMTNEVPAGSAALYAPSYEVTGEVTVIGGTTAFYITGGDKATFNGATVNVSNCTIGFQGKVDITNSLMEISTSSRAFNSSVTASFTDDYEVRSGASPTDNTLYPVKDGTVSSSAWFGAYTKLSYAAKISSDLTSISFDDLISGYESVPAAKTVTLTNVGLGDITDLTVALRTGDQDFFTLNTENTATSLTVGGSTSFTVQPKIGLSAGQHDAVILVNAGGVTVAEIPVSIDIVPAEPEALFMATGDSTGTLSQVTTAMKYSVDGGIAWKDITAGTMEITDVSADKDIKIYQPGDNTADSAVQTIDITQAQQPTSPSGVACTTSQQNDGQIIGVDTTMEYKLSTASQWLPINGRTVTGLPNGTYEVRVKASGTMLASPAKSVEVAAHICVAEGEWQTGENSHWKLCECGEVINKAGHTFEWVTDKAATATEAGSRHEECTVCGYAKAAVEIPATGSDSSIPQTGDESNIVLWVVIMLMAGAAMAGTAVYSRKRKFDR